MAAKRLRKRHVKHAGIVYAFGSRLRELRLSRGMSQAELARRAEIHLTYVGRLEKGLAAPGLDLLERLADALGTPLAELLPKGGTSTETIGFLQSQASRRLDAIFKVADPAALGILNGLLQMVYESLSRGR